MVRSKSASSAPATAEVAPPFEFEQSMSELEAVVARLEQGDVPLEEALASFARADGTHATVPFDEHDDEAE